MLEVRLTIELECVESDARHIIRSSTAVQLDGRDPATMILTDEAYSLLDHAFRKADEALDHAKAQLRVAAKFKQ